MCRWAAWVGAPIFLSEVITGPRHSLIAQSRAASQCKTQTNADGFGVAWYDRRPEPGLYRDVHPAWSDPNLASLAGQIAAPLFLAHVRASTGTATSRNNCHPFAVGHWSFMHNGQVGGFEHFRKRADMLIADDLYSQRRGATDSEALFLIALGLGLDSDPCAAFEQAVAILEDMARSHGTLPYFRLTAALSDGQALYAMRYASDDLAPSLYFRRDTQRGGWAVVSEPLEDEGADWTPVPTGSFCRFESAGHEIRPFAPMPLALAG